MVDQVANFKKVTVSTGYNNTATSIVLATGQGAELPDPSGDNYNLVWWDSTNYNDPADDPNVEIVRVTAKSTDTLTVTRNQESSGASNKNNADATYKMILPTTAKTITDLIADVEKAATVIVGKSGHVDYLTTDYGSDDACIQAAIDYVNGLGGGSVLVREGTYTITSTITLCDYLYFSGVGKGTIFEAASAIQVFELLGTDAVTGRLKNLDMCNFLIDGGSYLSGGIKIKYVDESTFDNIRIYDLAGHGLDIESCFINRYTNLDFHWCGFESSSKYATYIHNSGAVSEDVNTNQYFTGCRWEKCVGYSIYINSPVGTKSWAINFTNCLMHGLSIGHGSQTSYIIYIDGLTKSTFSKCRFPLAGTTGHMYLKNTTHSNISKCQFDDGSGYSLKLDISEVNNVIDCYIDNGLILVASSMNIISNSIIHSASAMSGIDMDATSHRNMIASNTIRLNDYHGIKCLANRETIISNNTIWNNSQDTADTYSGIYLSSALDANVCANNIVEVASKQKYGIELNGSPSRCIISKNNCRNNTTGAILAVNGNYITDNYDFNPVGSFAAPAVPATTVNYTNVYGYPCQVQVYGGTITEIDIDDIATGLTSGIFMIPPGGTINITYSAAPSWRWWGL